MTTRLGRQADLARDLGISRAAVSQAFKKHQIQVPLDGKFDLDYYGWLLKEKQNAVRSKAQRSAKKQIAGVKNPRVRREVIRYLTPIWQKAIFKFIQTLADGAFDNQDDVNDLVGQIISAGILWEAFHDVCDEELQPDLSDFPYQKPDVLQIDFYSLSNDQRQMLMEKIVGYQVTDPDKRITDIDIPPLSDFDCFREENNEKL